MRHLGIDYGEKRIGIALSDPEGRIAFPRKVIFNRSVKQALADIKKVLEDEKVSRVVIGLPVGLSGRETGETQKVRAFGEALKKEIVLPVEFENEMLTSRMAERAGIKKEHVDESAAALILQSYLDKQNKN